MAVNEKQWMGGITGARYDELSNMDPPRIDDEWPVDSDGCKLSLPPCYQETMDRAPEGVIRVMGNGQPLDPSVSQAQNRAMHAAAEGHSNLGIPQSVGQDFVAADHNRKVGSLPERKQR